MRALLAFTVVVAAFVAACAPNAAPVAKPYTVRDGFIRDVDGRAFIMRGVNISGAHKLPPFFDFHQADDYAQVRRDWGMNAARFLVSWGALEPEPGNYDEHYISEIKKRMQWAKAAGLVVVIDMHQDLYGLGFTVDGYNIGNGAPAWTCDASHYSSFASGYDPSSDWFLNYLNQDIVACYDGFWQSDDLWSHYANAVAHLASALADDDAVIGVDLINEPYWGSAEMSKFESQDLQLFYERIIPTIREASPRLLIFAEPASSRNLDVPTGLTPLPFDDVVYAPHSYDASAEKGDGFPLDDRAGVLDNMQKLRAEATALHAALWIGEYGGTGNANNIAAYMDAEYDAAAAVAGSTMQYDDTKNDDGYGMLDSAGNEKPTLVDALVRPYPERVVGTPVSYAFDDVTHTFTLRRASNSGSNVGGPGTTDIVLPTRVYPGDVDVSCGGCTFTRDGQVLHVNGGGTLITVTPR